MLRDGILSLTAAYDNIGRFRRQRFIFCCIRLFYIILSVDNVETVSYVNGYFKVTTI